MKRKHHKNDTHFKRPVFEKVRVLVNDLVRFVDLLRLLDLLLYGQPGEDAVPVPLDPLLVQHQPGHGPGDLQHEDEGNADGGRDAEAAQPRHDLHGH